MVWHSMRILPVLALMLLGGCGSTGSGLPPLPDDPPIAQSYILGPGDKLAIHLYGIDDLSGGGATAGAAAGGATPGPGEYTISDAGQIGVPLIGEVTASGLTVSKLKYEITAKLAQGYIKDPKVGVEVLAYRPFYIFGEVNHPGSFPYAANLNVLSAVATAGGFTYRADESFVVIERKVDGKTVKGKGDPGTAIRPDDIVRVPERFF